MASAAALLAAALLLVALGHATAWTAKEVNDCGIAKASASLQACSKQHLVSNMGTVDAQIKTFLKCARKVDIEKATKITSCLDEKKEEHSLSLDYIYTQ